MAASTTQPASKYGFFTSFQRGDPDETFARDILGKLQAAGFKGASSNLV